jgi:RimJ/RimL family protein N-acetyltransferase
MRWNARRLDSRRRHRPPLPIAGRALALLMESVRVRRVFTRAASDNVESLKVLQRAGFAIIGTAISFAHA